MTSKSLFDEIAPPQADDKPIEPFALVMIVPKSYRPGWDDRQRPPQKTASCFAFDGGVLPVLNPDERMTTKNIVFAVHNWMKRMVDQTGFKDDKGNLWFFLPTNVHPNKNDAYWFRNINFDEAIEYANILKENKKELKKKIENVLAIRKQTLTGPKQA